MQTNIHLTHDNDLAEFPAVAEIHSGYTSIDLCESKTDERKGNKVVVFVDARSALAIAKAAVEAYNALSESNVALYEVFALPPGHGHFATPVD
jgi:hypothetical protein